MTAPAPAPVHTAVPTALGTYVIAARGDALTGIWRRDQAHFPRTDRLGAEAPEHPVLVEAARQLVDYLAGHREEFDLPLAPEGTVFQTRVWARLATIPRGTVTTYGEIARELGSPRGAQAVGRAVGTNPLSIVVPCHRVVSSTGELTGYAGGIDTKRALLVLEGVALA